MVDKFKFTQVEFKVLKLKIQSSPLEITISTGSMSPWIRAGEVVKVSAINPDLLQPFDIIVFFDGKSLICHMIYKINTENIITIGLNSYKFDRPVEFKNILGIVDNLKFSFVRKWLLKRKIGKLEEKLAGAEGFEPPTY